MSEISQKKVVRTANHIKGTMTNKEILATCLLLLTSLFARWEDMHER